MNSDWSEAASPFHSGEQDVQTRMGVRDKIEAIGQRMLRDYLPEQHRDFYTLLPFLLVGMVDEQGRPWASLLTGSPGFITSPDARHLRIETQPLFGSPFADQFRVGADVGILGILPENRRRNRSTGRIVAIDDTGMTIAIAQTFGNCPQYIQTREMEVLPGILNPQQEKEVESGDRLDDKAKALIERSDTLFIATAYSDNQAHTSEDNPAFGADVSHRGGKPGFVRIEDDQTLIFPDFTGNFIFNTLGNILVNPKAGFLFIDFETRDLLYLTGRAEIIWEGDEVKNFLAAERFIRFHVEAWRRVSSSLPIKFEFGEYSPILKYSGSWEAMDANLAAEQERNIYTDYDVFKVEPESEIISSFYLRRADGKSLPAYEPGQFLPIRLTIPGESDPVTRIYTLSDAPYKEHYRLSIKREGLASQFFHDHIRVGSRLEAMAPKGKFTLDRSSDRPVVLLSAGVGITPMMAIATFLIEDGLRTRANTLRPTYFIHGSRNGKVHAFGETIRDLAAAYPALTAHIRYSHPEDTDQLGRDYDSKGHVDIALLKQLLPFDSRDSAGHFDGDFYLCGPQAFMQDLYKGLTAMGIQGDRIHYESFGPATVLEKAPPKTTPQKTTPLSRGETASGPVKVRFAKSNINTEWSPKSGTLLEWAEANGLEPPYSCRGGICGVCATRIQCGTVDYIEEPTGHFAEGEALICCSTPRSPSGEQTCSDDMGVVLDL